MPQSPSFCFKALIFETSPKQVMFVSNALFLLFNYGEKWLPIFIVIDALAQATKRGD